MDLNSETRVALEAVALASRVCLAVQKSLEGGTLQKGDRSPVTVADFAVQAVISRHLSAAFPGLPLLGEEDAQALRGPEGEALAGRVAEAVGIAMPGVGLSEVLEAIDRGGHEGGGRGRFWTLDPIDGTRGFLRREQYAIALALIEDGRVVLGVLGCPALPVEVGRPEAGSGVLFSARRGHGAFVHGLDGTGGRPVRVSAQTRAAALRFCESVEAAHSNQSDAAEVARRLGIEAAPYRIDSQCKYAAVARGDAEIYLRLPTKPGYVERVWDHAAGALLVEEAGGRVSDVQGRPLDFSRGRGLEGNRGVIATHGPRHEEVVAAVGAVLAG